ncbi:hypothetical protein DW674_00615 [Mitsuokella multacida]|uniref:Uncharacterized protein n=2 Tax=Mitsuokella multacida TaxID=52226 RepID=A0A414NZT6_9FIRM|nr:hypothetical protein DW674_00615 [Mitsuokella multacida]
MYPGSMPPPLLPLPARQGLILCKPLSQSAVLLAQGVDLFLPLDALDNRIFNLFAALREPFGLLAQALP